MPKAARRNNNINNNGSTKRRRKNSATDTKKVLVLCQRKTGDHDAEKVERDVKKINDYVEDYFKTPIQIEYLSEMGPHQGTADYRINFDDNEETKKFVDTHKNQYSMIILYTCPFIIFYDSEFKLQKLNSLLVNKGILVFKQNKKDAINNALEDNQYQHSKFYQREPFNKYFIDAGNDSEGSKIFISYNNKNKNNKSMVSGIRRNRVLSALNRLSARTTRRRNN